MPTAQLIPSDRLTLPLLADCCAPVVRQVIQPEEAATLAAIHSKARSSGTVAVDWTRRKHVRKPRGAPPGGAIIAAGEPFARQTSCPLSRCWGLSQLFTSA